MPDRDSAALDLAAVSARFADLLHAAGVAVSPERAGRWATALQLARPATTQELYWLGRVTLTLDRAEIGVYDAVFASVFRGLTDVAGSRGDPNAPPIPPPILGGDPAQQGGADAGAVRSGPPRASPHRESPTEGDGGRDDRVTESAVAAPATSDELLRRRDFADCTPEELAQLRRIMSAMQLAPPLRTSRRQRRHHLGRSIDRRATMRHARRTGGQPFDLRQRRPSERRRRVVLVADVSGSMESYSRAYLYLLHGSVRALRALRAETFVFATRLTRLTRQLRTNGTDPERALRAAVGDVDDWSGGTRIGESLRAFNDRWGRRGLARGAVVVIVSDGWESGDAAELGEQMARLRRLAHRIIWVNPRSKSEQYQPLVAGMAAALPYVDRFASGHSLDALDEVLDAISTRFL
jgi:uncharacterized protein with von Willebrand factor type A (vWA) domain